MAAAPHSEDKDLAPIQVGDKQTWRLRLILVEDKDLAPIHRLRISKRGGCASFWLRIRTWPIHRL